MIATETKTCSTNKTPEQFQKHTAFELNESSLTYDENNEELMPTQLQKTLKTIRTVFGKENPRQIKSFNLQIIIEISIIFDQQRTSKHVTSKLLF